MIAHSRVYILWEDFYKLTGSFTSSPFHECQCEMGHPLRDVYLKQHDVQKKCICLEHSILREESIPL